jgi:ABC-type methionine transport system ATPase subunit
MPLDYSHHNINAKEATARGTKLLELVGLGHRMDHHPAQMSGGQQQRVAIARALVNQPALLLADEPTGNLDSTTTEEILQTFRKLNDEEGLTIVIVTHEADVGKHCKRIIRMRDGRIEGDDNEVDRPAHVPHATVQPGPAKEDLLSILAAKEHQVHEVLGGLSAEDQTELSRLLSAWTRHLPEVSTQDKSSQAARGT